MGTSVLLPILLLLLVVFMFSRQRRVQQRQAAQQRESLQPGARVMTTSGLHATVITVEGDTVELEIAPGVRTTWLARAVARRVDDPAATEQATATTDPPALGPDAASAPGAADLHGTAAGSTGAGTTAPGSTAPGTPAPGDDAGGAHRPGAV